MIIQRSGSELPITQIRSDEKRRDMIEAACEQSMFGLNGYLRLVDGGDWIVYNTMAQWREDFQEFIPVVNDFPENEVLDDLENGNIEHAMKTLSMDADDIILALCRVYGSEARIRFTSNDSTYRRWYHVEDRKRDFFRARKTS